MNRLKYFILSAAATAALCMGLTACQDDFDNPLSGAAPTASKQANMTILELKEMFWQDDVNYICPIGGYYADAQGNPVVFDHEFVVEGLTFVPDDQQYVIKGRVISCDEAGNVFKNLVIQDETAALSLSVNSYNLYLNYRVGQEVVIDCKGMFIGKYNSLMQLGYPQWYANNAVWEASFMAPEFFKSHVELNGFPEPDKIRTLVVNSFSELSTNPDGLMKWQSQLVRFNNVTFQNGGVETFSTYHSSGVDQPLLDSNGSSIIVRTSGYSNFWNQTLPAGAGDLVAILSYYGTSSSAKWQVIMIDADGCMNFGNPTLTPGSEGNPYTVDQAVAIEAAGQTAYNQWVSGYIVGTVGPMLETVTSVDDIDWTAEPALANTLVIGLTPDAKSLDQVLVMPLTSGSDLRKYGALRENPGNYHKAIKVRGNFETYMGTYGITGNNGTTAEFEIEGLDLDTSGDGTETKPYNCNQVIAMNPQSTTDAVASGVWVSGYVVGYYENYAAHFEVATSQRANILISDSPTAADMSQCVCIQLVAQTDARNALNLVDNPTVLGKLVSVKGDVMKYNTLPGIKNTSEYTIDGNSGGGGDTPATGSALYEETFGTSQGLFTIHNVNLPAAASYIWMYDSSYHYMKASAYISGTSYASDSWLVSPMLDLSKATAPVLTFDHCTNKFPSADVAKRQCTLAVSVDGGDWTPVAIPTYSDNASWTFVSSGNIDLSAYAGKKILLGFHYTSEDGVSGTWELKNVKITGSGSVTATATDVMPGGGSQGGGNQGGGNQGGGDVTPDDTYKGNFSTFNDGKVKTTYGTYTNATGWSAVNAQVISGQEPGVDDTTGYYAFIGTKSTIAVCLNGKSGATGVLTSPTLTGGCGKLTFNYGFPYTDTKCQFTVNIKQGGNVVKTQTVTLNTLTVKQVYSFEMDVNVTGDFVIEIVNDALGAVSNKNTERVAIWNLTWTE